MDSLCPSHFAFAAGSFVCRHVDFLVWLTEKHYINLIFVVNSVPPHFADREKNGKILSLTCKD